MTSVIAFWLLIQDDCGCTASIERVQSHVKIDRAPGVQGKITSFSGKIDATIKASGPLGSKLSTTFALGPQMEVKATILYWLKGHPEAKAELNPPYVNQVGYLAAVDERAVTCDAKEHKVSFEIKSLDALIKGIVPTMKVDIDANPAHYGIDTTRYDYEVVGATLFLKGNEWGFLILPTTNCGRDFANDLLEEAWKLNDAGNGKSDSKKADKPKR